MEESVNDIKPIKKKRWFLKIIYFFVALFLIVDTFLFFFATPVLKTYLQQKVHEQTNGLFSLDFERISIELSTRRLSLENFKLVSDTSVYSKLEKENETSTALYNISCGSVELWRIGAYSLLFKNRLNALELKLVDPIVELKKLPVNDSLKSASRDFVHEDLFPAVSEYLHEIKIKLIHVENGKFLLNLNKDSITNTTHIGNVSIKLFNFLLNDEQYKKRSKLFFSNELQIIIDDYKVNLSDKIHYIYANSISISTKTSKLLAANVGMAPLNESKQFLRTINNNYYRISAPAIEFNNFDIYELYFKNDIKIGQVSVNNPSIEVVNILKRAGKKKEKYNESMEIDLSKLIAGKLHSVLIDTFNIKQGTLLFYYNNWLSQPIYKARKISLNLINFDLQKNSNDIQTKIFYSDELKLTIDTFSTILPDKAHYLMVNSIELLTKEKTITASGLNLQPIAKQMSLNRLTIQIPNLKVSGADFFKLYHQRIFNISRLLISPSNFNIRIWEKIKEEKEAISKKNPLSILTTNFIKQLYIRDFNLKQSRFKISMAENDSVSFVYQGNAAFELKRFLINPLSFVLKSGNPFYSDQFSLKLKNYKQDLKDQVHILESNALEVSNIDSLVEITGFKIKPKNKNNISSISKNKIFDIDLIQASIKGIDIGKAYFDSSLIASSISILRPNIRISNYFWKKHQKKQAQINFIDSLPDNKKVLPDSLVLLDSSSTGTLRSILAGYFKQINVQALNIEKANVSISDIDSFNNKDLIMSGKLSAKLNKFFFNPRTQILNKQISYSDNISFRITDYFGKLFDKKYQLKIKQAKFSSRDSVFSARLVRLFPTREHSSSKYTIQLWNFYAPYIETEHTNISELIDFNVLNLGNLNIKNPSLALTKKSSGAEKPLKITQDSIKKAMGITQIKFDEINIENGVFGILKDKFSFENLSLNTKIDLKIRNLEIDTTSFSNPEQFLSNLNATVRLRDVHYQLPDSLHFIDVKKIQLNILSKKIDGNSLKYYTIGNNYHKKYNFALNEFFIPEFSFTGFGYSELLFKKKMNANVLVINQPVLNFITKKKKQGNTPVNFSKLNLYDKIKKQFNSLNINKVTINNAKVLHTKKDGFNSVDSEYDRIYANITGLLIDSLHQNDGRILNAEDISVKMEDYGFNFSNNLYRLDIKELGFSTGQQSFFANSIYLNPTKGRKEYSRARKKETNLNYLKSKSLQAKGVNFHKLINDRQLVINKIDINNVQFHSFKNKQYPLDSTFKVALPLEYVRESKNLIKIDTLNVHNSYIGYEILGKNARETGIIDFTNINGKILNLTNDKKSIKKNEETVIKASGYVMDQSLLTASYHFPLGSEYGEYIYGGTLDTLDMKTLNPLLENLFFVSIEDGKINNMSFTINANEDYAEGKLEMLYNDLKIDLISKKKSDSLVVEKRGLFSMVANSIIKDSNPRRKGGFVKEGRVYFERNVYKSVFNYWTFAILSGMQSTLGFKSKQLKERLKIEKGSEKYAKKSDRKNIRIDKKTAKTIEKQIHQELKDEEKKRRKEEKKKKKKHKSPMASQLFIKPENHFKLLVA